jgi:hypothetical protein
MFFSCVAFCLRRYASSNARPGSAPGALRRPAPRAYPRLLLLPLVVPTLLVPVALRWVAGAAAQPAREPVTRARPERATR